MENIAVALKLKIICPCCFSQFQTMIKEDSIFSIQCNYCCSVIPIYSINSLFYGFKLKPYLVLFIKYLYFQQLNVRQIRRILKGKVSKLSIIRLIHIFKIKIHEFIENKLRALILNGTIEIDETYLPKSKFYYRFGRRVSRQYVFGIFCREQKIPLLFTIPNRKAETIIPIILGNVNFGGLIYSDCFSVYVDNIKNPKESHFN